jgi:hypothetical protein
MAKGAEPRKSGPVPATGWGTGTEAYPHSDSDMCGILEGSRPIAGRSRQTREDESLKAAVRPLRTKPPLPPFAPKDKRLAETQSIVRFSNSIAALASIARRHVDAVRIRVGNINRRVFHLVRQAVGQLGIPEDGEPEGLIEVPRAVTIDDPLRCGLQSIARVGLNHVRHPTAHGALAEDDFGAIALAVASDLISHFRVASRRAACTSCG